MAPDNGCVEGYNFKHPHPCKPNEDCKFVVKWRTLQKSTEDNPGMAEFEVMATLPQDHSQESVWVALGFSFDSKMVSKLHLKYCVNRDCIKQSGVLSME